MAARPIIQTTRWALCFVSMFLSALFLAWIVSAQQQFFYPLWYQQLNIGNTIAVYGPQNRNINGFENTTKEERLRLFAAINKAVHEHGEGLETLTFYDPENQQVKPFLTTPEIIHLQDVATLIATVFKVGVGALSLFILMLGYNLWRRTPLPSLTRFHMIGAGFLLGLGGLTLGIGAEAVFYQFHIWVFPPGHPWFFYYQDSLMSTSMQAPNLFGAIAVQLLVFTLVIDGLGLLLLQKYYPHRVRAD